MGRPHRFIEPAGWQFSSVYFGLSSCVFSPTQFAAGADACLRAADVLPRAVGSLVETPACDRARHHGHRAVTFSLGLLVLLGHKR